MKRYFNTTGFCRPELHYMVDPLRGLEKEIYRLIEREQYFVIHAPRQTGKTTLLHSLAHKLNKEGRYISSVISVERAGYKSISIEEANYSICNALYNSCKNFINKKFFPAEPENNKRITFYNYLSDWISSLDKPAVLLIDEIDSLYDDVLVSLLRQLRDGFQSRPKHFPASVALVGLRDVRDYKLKSKYSDRSLGSGSPFNIKAESFMLGNFSKDMMKNLYSQHTRDTGQVFSDEVTELIYSFTGGQPWLVNAIADEIIVKILEEDFSKEITKKIVTTAKENLIQRRDTHLDSLLDKLKEERVKNIVSNVISGDSPLYDTFNDDLRYCIDLGIIKNEDNIISFSNHIYKEIIPRVLNYHWQMGIGEEGETNRYIKNHRLDMDKLLKAFQTFYRRHSEHWIDIFNYKEAGQQLLLMAFLQRIINAGGRIEREMAVGRGRTDLTIYYGNDIFVLELKLKRDEYVYKEGMDQLSRYLDTIGSEKGYLILFELKNSKEVPWESRLKWKAVQHSFGKSIKKITVVEM
ncbi:MAG: ATP-binding protein [Bacteroidetes bacterium]|nr:ATP-binding protein [Bacteroidota bacterium]